VGRGNQGGLPPIGGGGRGGGIAPFAQQNNAPHNAMQMYSNIIKRYANWNVCFSCGFDVEDGHTSKKCPAPWRRTNHQGDTLVPTLGSIFWQDMTHARRQCTSPSYQPPTLGSIFWQDMMHARRQCTSPSYQPCDGAAEQLGFKCLNSFIEEPVLYPTQNI